jgi:HAMP domain-containing protein
MVLSAFDWAVILALASLLWFLLVRDFRSRDRLAATVEKLGLTVSDLRTWMAENYVTRPEHLREIERLETSISEHADRWREDLDRHRIECPGRRPPTP